MLEINILVAARQACGDQFSGRVSASIRAHAGKEGITLNTFGRGPDLYLWRKRPSLHEWKFSRMQCEISVSADFVYASTTFGSSPRAGFGLSWSGVVRDEFLNRGCDI